MSRIADRIASNTKEHWVLYILGVDRILTPERIYDASKGTFPSAEFIKCALDELCSRNLARKVPAGYKINSNGSVALKHHGKPTERFVEHSSEVEWEPVEEPEWVETDLPRVFYASKGDTFKGKKVGLKLAYKVSKIFPNKEVVIHVAPYLPYDVGYQIRDHVIDLVIYSVRPDTSKWEDSLIWELQRKKKRLEDD